MRGHLLCFALVTVLAACISVVRGAAPPGAREVRGVVLDTDGRPVANADVAPYWTANGTQRDKKGEVLGIKERWSNVGQLAPHLGRGVQTDQLGKFVITVPPKKRVLMAMDQQRQRGGIVFIDPDKEDARVVIQVQSLVQVKGSYRFPNLQPDWTFTTVRTRDVDSTIVLVCGSFNRDFVFKLPPGAYVVEGYGEMLSTLTRTTSKDITLSGGNAQVDVGVLELRPGFVLQSKLAGRWGNLAEYYGKEPPKWQIADARGLPKNINVPLNYWFFKICCSNVRSKRRRFFSSDLSA